MMVALTAMAAACNKNHIASNQQPANEEITITATVNQDGVMTRVLGIDGDNIASTWEDTDEFAILFNDGESAVKRIATVDKIVGTTVTVSFTIPGDLANNTNCTIVYPASAANAANTGADVATALATQEGTIGNCPEVRVGTAIIDKNTKTLSSVTQLEAQNAIFKFTLGSAIDATHPLIIKDGSDNTIVTVTPTASITEAYVAMPAAASTTYKFQANTADNKIVKSGAATIVAGKYYQTPLPASYPKSLDNVNADDLGSVITSDGYICLNAAGATAAGKTIVAMIAYVYLDNTLNWHGLAVQLNSTPPYKTWSGAKSYVAGLPAVAGRLWSLASNDDWLNMFLACRIDGDASSKPTSWDPVDGTDILRIDGFKEKIKATGVAWLSRGVDIGCWSSTDAGAGRNNAWSVVIDLDYSPGNMFFIGDSKAYEEPVRACLPF